MPTYVKPQVLVFQEFSLAASEITDALRAWIVGPNKNLFRFDDPDEKILIAVGQYDRSNETVYPWPGRTAGSIIDEASVKLFIEDALLLYLTDLIGDETGGRGILTPVVGQKNYVRHDTINFRANGTTWPRSALLNDRDAEIGDVVHLRSVTGGDACDENEMCTVIEGFAADVVAAVVNDLTLDVNNQTSTIAGVTIEQLAGNTNCLSVTADGSTYDGLPSGFVSECYTIEVIQSSVSGCNAARLRVTTDSGTDNVEEVTPEALGVPTVIGTRGLTVTWGNDIICSSNSVSSYSTSELLPDDFQEFEVGQIWKVCVTEQFEQVCAESGSVYTGPDDDTYIIEVTKGAIFAEFPEVTITTVKGLDSSGPTIVSGVNIDIAVGSYGLTMQFKDCGDLTGGSSLVASSASFGMGDDALDGLRLGDKFYITVLTGANGPVRTLILRDDLNAAMRTASDLDLRLFIPKTIEVTENRLSSPPLVNYEIEPTQLVVKAGITAFCSTWTKDGVEQPLPVWDTCAATPYGQSFSNLFIEYCENLAELTTQLNFIDDIADIDQIPGQLDERNTLKWGVYRALQNSGGTRVAYTAVSDADSLEAWQTALERADGRDDIYNYVPLTYDREVHNLYQAQVNAESTPERGNWKAMFINLLGKTETMVVGLSDADTQSLTPTSVDGEVVLATLEDNPGATDIQYTLLSVPDANGGFITHGVKAGDIVRFLFTIDAFGDATYSEFVVDTVLSEESLLLLAGHTSAISVPQKIEIWHTFDKNEIAADLVDQAQSFADRRVVATWPDIVGTAGNAQAGYFLAAALAGLVSGVVPHQGLTNIAIAGFDDLASRTKDFFSGSQLDTLAAGGVWIATEDFDGTPHTRHALTTDTTDLNSSEEMIRRNLDSMSFVFKSRLKQYIGRANVTPSMLTRTRYELNRTISFFKNNGYTPELGPQLIEGAIATDENGAEILRIHPLAADRIEAVVNLDLPEPLNNFELHLVV